MSDSDARRGQDVLFASLPLPALRFRGFVCVAANAAYEAFMGYRAEQVVGRGVGALIELVATEGTSYVLEETWRRFSTHLPSSGELWCKVTDARGELRAVRVQWSLRDEASDEFYVFLSDAEAEHQAKELAEALARAGGELVRCEDERDVLERAADALSAQSLEVSILLFPSDGGPLEYGPHRSLPKSPPLDDRVRAALLASRPARDTLHRLNPRFDEQRAAFFDDPRPAVELAYPAFPRSALDAALAGTHLVQAPLFVDGEPYGALIVRSPTLTPSRAATIEMFAGLVARAIESVCMRRGAAARLEELQRLQTELLEHERLAALGEAAAVMAHEVRNPIAAILNAIAVLRRQAPIAGDAGEMVRVIAEEAARLERLVRDLLDLGRPLRPRPHATDLGELAKTCAGIVGSRPADEALEVRIVDESPPTFAWVDPDLLQLALMNVLQNAAQANGGAGTVLLRVSASNDGAVVSVEDQGPGFSDEVSRRMFEPFYTTRAAGTGIGLAVVRRIVEACAGAIEVDRAPAGGARFRMRFPIAAAE
jgi:two-component system sensor histidine kinase HydH